MLNALVLVGLMAAPPAANPAIVYMPQTVIDRDAVEQAHRIAEREREQAEQHQVDIASVVYAGTAGADWAVTAVCFKVRCADQPDEQQVGLFLHGVRPTPAAWLGVGIDAGIVLLARTVIAPDHPKLALVLLYGLSAARVVILANHIADLRANTVRRPVIR